MLNNPVEHVEMLLNGTSQEPWAAIGPTADDDTIRIIGADGRTVATISHNGAGWERMTALADARFLVEAPTLARSMAKEVVHALGEEDRVEAVQRDLTEAENTIEDLRSDYMSLARRIAERISDLSVDAFETADAMRAAAEAIARAEADDV